MSRSLSEWQKVGVIGVDAGLCWVEGEAQGDKEEDDVPY